VTRPLALPCLQYKANYKKHPSLTHCDGELNCSATVLQAESKVSPELAQFWFDIDSVVSWID
jgi:hypothetical protein